MIKILLDEKIFSLRINGRALPHNIREFSVDRDDFSLSGDCPFGSFFAIVENGLIKCGNAVLQKFGDRRFLSAMAEPIDRVEEKTTFRAFGFPVTASLLVRNGAYFTIIESDDRFVAVPCDKNAKTFFCDEGVVVKTEDALFVVTFDGDFSCSEKIPHTSFSLEKNVLFVEYLAPTTEGIVVCSSFVLEGKSFSLKKREASFSRRGNYGKNTFPVAFFERVFYAAEKDVSEFLSPDFSAEDVLALKEFIGKSEIVAFDGKNVLLENGRCFFLHIEKGKVVNVSEVD